MNVIEALTDGLKKLNETVTICNSFHTTDQNALDAALVFEQMGIETMTLPVGTIISMLKRPINERNAIVNKLNQSKDELRTAINYQEAEEAQAQVSEPTSD